MNSNEVIKTLTKIAIQYDEESEESRALGRAIECVKTLMLYEEWNEMERNQEAVLK